MCQNFETYTLIFDTIRMKMTYVFIISFFTPCLSFLFSLTLLPAEYLSLPFAHCWRSVLANLKLVGLKLANLKLRRPPQILHNSPLTSKRHPSCHTDILSDPPTFRSFLIDLWVWDLGWVPMCGFWIGVVWIPMVGWVCSLWDLLGWGFGPLVVSWLWQWLVEDFEFFFVEVFGFGICFGYLVLFVLSCILGGRGSSWLWRWL